MGLTSPVFLLYIVKELNTLLFPLPSYLVCSTRPLVKRDERSLDLDKETLFEIDGVGVFL